MNDFDEDKWTAAQRAVDWRITLEFEALEGSRATYEATGEPTEAWVASAQAQAAAIRAQVAELEHAGRRAHWDAQLARLGFAPTVAAPVAAPVAEPEAPVAEPEAPVAEPEAPARPRGRGR